MSTPRLARLPRTCHNLPFMRREQARRARPSALAGRPARRAWPRRLPSVSSAVLRPLREPSRGLTSRRASYVVPCTMGTSRSRARSAESSLSAMPSPWRRRSSAGVTSTIPTREFANPLSISRSNGVPRPTSFSLNQTETPRDSSRSCSSLAAPARSSHAWQRKTSRRSGRDARFSTLSRTGVSAAHLGRRVHHGRTGSRPARPCAAAGPAAAAPAAPAAPRRGVGRGRVRPVADCSRCSGHSGHRMQGRPLQRSLSDGPLLVLCI